RPAAFETGVEELERATLLADRDDLARFADHRLEQRRLPHVGDGLGLGMARHLTRQLPEAVDLGGMHPLVEIRLDRGERLASHVADLLRESPLCESRATR